MNRILDILQSDKYILKIDWNKLIYKYRYRKNQNFLQHREKECFNILYTNAIWSNAPATFQRLMDKIMTPDLKPKVFAYLDDIIIVSQDFNEHLYYLNAFYLAVPRCIVCQRALVFSRYVLCASLLSARSFPPWRINLKRPK